MILADSLRLLSCQVKNLAILILSILLLPSCNKKNQIPIELSGFALGTTYSIKISRSEGEIERDVLHNSIKDKLDEIESSMSVHLKDSTISQLNNLNHSQWIEASDELITVLSEAKKLSELTKGAFDFTIGELIEIWGFGVSAYERKIPSNEEIAKAKESNDYQGISIRPKSRTVSKKRSETKVNLSAIAKGYAVDAVSHLLKKNAINNFLVEIGGEIRTNGRKLDKQPWRIAIEKPLIDQRSIHKIVTLENSSMATSGDYRNFFEVEGKRFSHTINPSTGWPVENEIASVSVISPSCMIADGMATALMVMGFNKGKAFAEEHNLAVFWILRREGELIDESTQSFKNYIQ